MLDIMLDVNVGNQTQWEKQDLEKTSFSKRKVYFTIVANCNNSNLRATFFKNSKLNGFRFKSLCGFNKIQTKV